MEHTKYARVIAKARNQACQILIGRHRDEFEKLLAIEHQKHGLIAKYRTPEQQIAWHMDKIAELEAKLDNKPALV